MREFEIGDKVYGIYGSTSYIIGNISKIEGEKISILCNKTTITLTWDDVWFNIPEGKKEFFI